MSPPDCKCLYLILSTDKAEGLLTRSNSQSAPAKPSTTTTTASEGLEPMQVDSANQSAAAETALTEKVRKLHVQCTVYCVFRLLAAQALNLKVSLLSSQGRQLGLLKVQYHCVLNHDIMVGVCRRWSC